MGDAARGSELIAQTKKCVIPHEASYLSTLVYRIPLPEYELQIVRWLVFCATPLKDIFNVQVVCDEVGRL